MGLEEEVELTIDEVVFVCLVSVGEEWESTAANDEAIYVKGGGASTRRPEIVGGRVLVLA